jgi:flagellar biosynthesis protein FlhF
MQIKRFRAETAGKALMMAKDEFGLDAVILSTKKVKDSGISQAGVKGPLVEVVAAIDFDNEKQPYSGAEKARDFSPPGKFEKILGEDIQNKKMESLEEEMRGLKRMVSFIAREVQRDKLSKLSGQDLSLYQDLVGRGLHSSLAYKLIRKSLPLSLKGDIGREDNIRMNVKGLLSNCIEEAKLVERGKKKQKVVALIGPTGVGKTTTLAKLAALHAFEKKEKVAILTLDTFRIGAAEQLKVYGKIMGLPTAVVSNREDIKRYVMNNSDKELVLLDTTGRNYRDEYHMKELMAINELKIPIKFNLVLSLTTRDKELIETAKRFIRLPVESLIFTKLDESESYGTMLNVVAAATMPISYFTAGQRVPEDIELATPDKLTDLMFGGSLTVH